jgi:hypothetical protein
MSAAAYLVWFLAMVVLAGAASLGAATWIYFRDEHRHDPERPADVRRPEDAAEDDLLGHAA